MYDRWRGWVYHGTWDTHPYPGHTHPRTYPSPASDTWSSSVETCPPPPKDRQTPVKTLRFHNFVCRQKDKNNYSLKWVEGEYPEIHKFERVSSDDHQMSVAEGGVGILGPCLGEGENVWGSVCPKGRGWVSPVIPTLFPWKGPRTRDTHTRQKGPGIFNLLPPR